MSGDKVRVVDGASRLIGSCTVDVVSRNIIAHGLLRSDGGWVATVRTSVTHFIWICVVTGDLNDKLIKLFTAESEKSLYNVDKQKQKWKSFMRKSFVDQSAF